MKLSPTPRLGPHAVCALLAWLLCSTLYLWTANGVVIRDDDKHNAWHHYEYLVDGFLSGHLSLSIEPAPELLALPDPYDPAQNFPYRLWDASLYKGKYYLYYGPTPAVLLMLPWKIITGQHLPQRLAVGIFAVVGLGALAFLLAGLRRRYFPNVSPTAFGFIVLLVGHITWLPVTLRRPAFWELPIVAAAALFWWALYLWWRYRETGRRRFGVASGLALALVLGARPTYLFTATAVLFLTALPLDRKTPLKAYLKRVGPVLFPLVVGGVALLFYNYLRFESFLEFGQSYQLWGFDERQVHHFSPAYIRFNAWNYFFSIPDIGVYFPFFHSGWPVEQPAGYIATEEVHGLLLTMPAHLLGVIALVCCWRRRKDAAMSSLCALVFAGSAASVLSAGVLFCFAGACSRYITELVAGTSVVTGVAALALFAHQKQRFRGDGALRLLGTLAAVWTMLCVWLASYAFRGFARITQPIVYPVIAEIFNYPSYWVARWTDQQFGSVEMDIRLASPSAIGSTVLLGTGSESMLDQLVLERIAPHEVRLRFTVNNLIMLETPVLHCESTNLHVTCSAPWLYPPAAHPFWQAFANSDDAKYRQTAYTISVNGTSYTRRSWWGFDATRFNPTVRTADKQPQETAWVEQWAYVEPSRWRTSGQ